MRTFSFPILPTVINNYVCPPNFINLHSVYINQAAAYFPYYDLLHLKRLVKRNKNWISKGKAKFVFDANRSVYTLSIKRVNKLPFTVKPSKGSFSVPSTALQKYGEYTVFKNGTVSAITQVDHVRLFEDKKVSVNTVGWASLPKRKRRLSFNPYTRRRDLLESDEAIVLDLVTGSTIYTSSWRLIGTPLPATSYNITNSVTNVQSRAINQALIRMKSSNVNLLNALGEGKQTIHLLLTAIRRLCLFSVRLKKLDFAGALKVLRECPVSFTQTRKHTQSIGSSVLEIQYGWKPLISDIQGFMKQLDTVIIPGLFMHSSSLSERNVIIKDRLISSGFLAGCNVREETTTVCKGRSCILSEIKNVSLVTAVGFGVTNPLSLAWELTPWSFVVDWFLPLGKTLDALDAALGRTFKAASDSWFYTVETRFTVLSYPKRFQMIRTPTVVRRTWSYQRAPRSSFPFPTVPQFKDPFSSQHLINSLALIDSSIRRR